MVIVLGGLLLEYVLSVLFWLVESWLRLSLLFVAIGKFCDSLAVLDFCCYL